MPLSSRAFQALKLGLQGKVPAFLTAFRTKVAQGEANSSAEVVDKSSFIPCWARPQAGPSQTSGHHPWTGRQATQSCSLLDESQMNFLGNLNISEGLGAFLVSSFQT